MKFLVRLEVSRTQDQNLDFMERMGIENTNRAEALKHVGSNVDLLFEVDTETGEHKLMGAGGFYLSSKSYLSEKANE